MSTPENTKFCDFTSTNNNDFICTPIAPPALEANFYEIKPALLNLVMKEQFSCVSTYDAAAHLNNFVELCEMQKYKDVDGDIIRVNWIYATITFTLWKNAITKIKLGNMPLKLSYTSIHAIFFS
jgi:hypothetical protein